MRVALVTESLLPREDGSSTTVRHVARHLAAAGHEPVLVAPGPGAPEHDGLPVQRVGRAGRARPHPHLIGVPDGEVRRVLAGIRSDLVHVGSPEALGAVALRAARRLGLPTVVSHSREPVTDRRLLRMHRRADRVLVPSAALRRRLVSYGVPDPQVWARGVSLDLFGPHRRDGALRRAWAADGEVVVGHVGRLTADKPLHRLADLAGLPGVRLVVIGAGPERAALERRLPGAVFTGFLAGEQLAAAFASLDVFVHLGEDATFCQTVPEAQASGVAVVAADRPAVRELVETGVSGLLHDPADPDGLRRAVATLAAEPLARQGLALGGRCAASGRTWGRLVAELVEVHYAAVLGSRAPGGHGGHGRGGPVAA